jgi:hypothetical protein
LTRPELFNYRAHHNDRKKQAKIHQDEDPEIFFPEKFVQVFLCHCKQKQRAHKHPKANSRNDVWFKFRPAPITQLASLGIQVA